MGNPIKFSELVDQSSVNAGFNDLIAQFKRAEKEAIASIKAIKKETKDIVVTDKGATDAMNQQIRGFREQKKAVDSSRKAQDQLIKLQERLKVSQSNVGIETAKVRDAIARQNRITKQQITLNRTTQGSMVALSIELGKNRQRYRELSAAQRANVNIGGKLLTTIKQQDANIKKLDASIGNNQRSIGDYGQALKGATRLLGALGLAGGIALVVRGVREMIGIFSGFEKQMAKVRAISGATDAEFALLNVDAKRLGESTEKTASQVSELQLAYAKLGFSTPQIIAATEATLDLATATDEDLAQSALVAAKTIKGFNLSAEETVRVTDVMALAFSSSALTLNAFQDAMKTVAPVALAVNSSLESTTAILSTLVDSGIEASTAGTSLRNIFIELETQGLTWGEAMEQVRNSTNKVKTATELFGKRASTAALIIANNSEKIDTLTNSYENAAGSAKVMADIMRDTLTGDVDRATSALQGMVIEIGDKLTPVLRAITRGFTFFISNIGIFIKIIGIAGAGLLAYKLITSGAAIAQRAYTIAVNIANIATRAFNTTVKASPLGLLAGLAATAVAAFLAFSDSTKEASKAQEEFTGKHKDFLEELAKEEAQLKTLFDALITAKEGTEVRTAAINEINRLYGEYLLNLLTEKSTLVEIAEAQTIANKAILQDIAIKSRQAEIVKTNTTLIETQRKLQDDIIQRIEKAQKKKLSLIDARLIRADINDIVNALIKAETATEKFFAGQKIDEFNKKFQLTTSVLGTLEASIPDIIVAQDAAAASIEETTAFYDQFIKALGLTKKEVDDTEDAIRSLIKIQEVLLAQAKELPETTEQELIVKNRKIKAIQTEIKRLKALGIETGKQKDKEIDLAKIQQRIQIARAKNIEEELKRVKIIEEVKFKIKSDNLEKERLALIKAGGDKLVINRLFEQLQTELLIEHERIRAEKRIATVLKNEKEINDIALKELELRLINQGATEEEINEALLDKKIELLEKEIILRKDIGAEILDQELELAKLREKIEKDHQDKLRELRDFGINEAIKAIQRKADAAISAADEEIAATEKQISRQD